MNKSKSALYIMETWHTICFHTFWVSFYRPSVLDSFALLSGQVNMLTRVLKNDKCPLLRNQILLPLLLIPERDPELEVGSLLIISTQVTSTKMT